MPPGDSELERWFAQQVQPHESMLRGWLRNRFRDENDVDDIVQEAFIRLLRARETMDVKLPKAFLFTVARNIALDRQRHRCVAGYKSLAETEAQTVLDEDRDVREIVAHDQEIELLTQAIQSLPDRCQQVFTLRKVYGFSQAEIATQLEISVNTVSAQLTIGLGKCRDFMAQARLERKGHRS
ncbi:MAG TPA: RNA polymerase sigma factor [Opitutaceae bacterium]